MEKDQEKKNKEEVSDSNKEKEKSKVAIKLEKIRAVKELSDPDSEWTIVQEILQEIQAYYTIKNPDSIPPMTRLIKELKQEIERRYKNEPEKMDLMLESIPSHNGVTKWTRKPTWKSAVWEKVREDGLFTKERRAEMINALFQRGKDKSDNAAKIWLTLSGDYSDKVEVQNDTLEKFRDINQVLHRKNNKDS